jgi:hypothetical protein
MKIIDKLIKVKSRSEKFEIYPLGDIHIGGRGCAEKALKKQVKAIVANPNAYILGGGDMLDLILPMDNKRFDFNTLPDWMLDGDAVTIRERLTDIQKQQLDRMETLLGPIPPERWLGILAGNHEYSILKYSNNDIAKAISNRLKTIQLTDEALIRLRFRRETGTKGNYSIATVVIYIRHGYGSGRTPGAEPNKLQRMLDEWEIADIAFTGHTHVFCILPPKAVLGIPRTGSLPPECTCRYRWAANWGCWQMSHPVGPGTYASRACYPARPLLTVKAVVKPFAFKRIKGREVQTPDIELRQIIL